MNGIDTNVLIRHLVQDDPQQSPQASAFIRNECSAESPGFVSCISLCELVWVLESAYGYTRSTIADVLDKVFRTNQLQIEDLPSAWLALGRYRRGKADFADNLLAVRNLRSGCGYTVTFDRAAAKEEGFRLLG